MAAKDSDETAAMFPHKRPRIDSDAVSLQHKTCSEVVNSLEQTSDSLMETPVVSYFNNRLSCSDVGNANPQVHHRYGDDDDNEEKEKNQIINTNNNKEDPKQQSMKEEDERYSDVRNHTNMGDEDEELQEGRRQQGAAKNDKNIEQMLLTAGKRKFDCWLHFYLSFKH